MKKRDLYLRKLLLFKDKSPVKAITGVRRCGKSTLLDLYAHSLAESGVAPSSILRINFEDIAFDQLRDYRSLHQHIQSWRQGSDAECAGKKYLLLDEIQHVAEWERAINSLRLDESWDITLTGSNAQMLSTELSTLMAGRYVEIPMLPLSFKEYLDFNQLERDAPPHELSTAFTRYCEIGGLPGLTDLRDVPEAVMPFLEGICSTILLKDVVQRNGLRDATLLENLTRFLASAIGSPLSTKSISDFLTSAGRKTTADTVDSYVRMLLDAYVFYQARRYDIKGKMHLKTYEKLYLVDPGLRGVLLRGRNGDIGHLLENIVFLEWVRRGWDVSVGKIGPLEVDLVCMNAERTIYCQVCASLLGKDTKERELRVLRAIPDLHERLIITLDPLYERNVEGIRIMHAIEFLLGDAY